MDLNLLKRHGSKYNYCRIEIIMYLRFSLVKGVATRVWARGDRVGGEARFEKVERRGEEEVVDEEGREWRGF